jgi:hypothetical protein
VRARATVAGKRVTKTRSRSAKRGKLTFQFGLPGGAALSASALRVQARRCVGSGKQRRCSGWTRKLATRVAGPAGPSKPTGPTTPTVATNGNPTIGGCPVFPSSNAFNQDVSELPVDARSDAYIASIGPSAMVHPDFGAADLGAGPGGFGIPYRVVDQSQELVPINFTDYGDESDPGPYPAPLDTAIEGGSGSDGDRHVLIVQKGACKLYELGNAYAKAGSWEASGGAVFDLNTGAPRPAGWTSADAAGLPILPGLARYDEVAAGLIQHALRFTIQRTQRAYIAPASHWASSVTDPNVPPMGLRLRMKAGYSLAGLHGQSLVVATALKRFGMIVADNGSNWYISGAPDPRWDDEDLNQLKGVPGSAFEVVQTGAVVRP